MYTAGTESGCYARDDRREWAETLATRIAEHGMTFGEKVDRAWVETVEEYVG
jgi:hypothetical protein